MKNTLFGYYPNNSLTLEMMELVKKRIGTRAGTFYSSSIYNTLKLIMFILISVDVLSKNNCEFWQHIAYIRRLS